MRFFVLFSSSAYILKLPMSPLKGTLLLRSFAMSNNTPYNVIFRCIYCMYPLHYRVPKQEDHEIKECATSSLLSKIHILNPIYCM